MILNVARTPIEPIPRGAAEVVIVVATAVAPGNVVYPPAEMTLNVDIPPGVVIVVNTSMVAMLDPAPPTRLNTSPG